MVIINEDSDLSALVNYFEFSLICIISKHRKKYVTPTASFLMANIIQKITDIVIAIAKNSLIVDFSVEESHTPNHSQNHQQAQ